MKKKSVFNTTVAAFMAALSFGGAPAAEAVQITQGTSTEATNPNKNANVTAEQKGQGISINNQTGGLGFDHIRMQDRPNPIYIPYYHPKQTYRAQVRKANKRRG